MDKGKKKETNLKKRQAKEHNGGASHDVKKPSGAGPENKNGNNFKKRDNKAQFKKKGKDFGHKRGNDGAKGASGDF